MSKRESRTTMNMTQGQPMKLLLLFALPLMFGSIFQQAYTVVDTAIVGRGVGMHALASLGIVDWLNWLIFSIAQGFTQGISIMVSQKYGEGDLKAIPAIAGQGALLMIILTVVLTAAGITGIPHFLRLMNAPEELRPLAALYSTILFGGFAASAFYNYTASMLRAEGDSRTPLIAMIAASLTNIALDSLTVFVLKWGIAGAAGATVFSQLTAGAICFLKMRKLPELRFGIRELKLTKDISMALIRLSLPVSLMNLIISVGGVFVQSVVNTFGVNFIAGYTATNKLYGLLEIAAVSYGYAITTYVGQNFGASNSLRIKKGVRSAIILSVLTSASIGAVMILFGRGILSFFLNSEDALSLAEASATAYRFLVLMASCLPILYLLYVYRSALQGMGHTRSAMISGFIEFFMRVGMAVSVIFTRFSDGVFIAEIAAWLGATVFLGISYYFKQRAFLISTRS